MLSRQFIRSSQLHIMRCFTRSSITRKINKMDKVPPQKNNETIKKAVIGTRMHRVTDFDKRVLVWVKRYPSIADVPMDVTVDCILTARNKARIKVCNYMIIATLIGCIGAVILGKRDASEGKNLVKRREEWLQTQIEKDKNK